MMQFLRDTEDDCVNEWKIPVLYRVLLNTINWSSALGILHDPELELINRCGLPALVRSFQSHIASTDLVLTHQFPWKQKIPHRDIST